MEDTIESLKIKLEMQHQFYLIAMERAERAEALAMKAREVLEAQTNNMSTGAFFALAGALNP